MDDENSQHYLTEMEIYKHEDVVRIKNQDLSSSIFWYARNGDAEMKLDTEHHLMKTECSQPINSCTEDHHGHRFFYVEEEGGKVDELFVVVVNTADLNDPDRIETFKAEFNRFKT